MLNQLTGQALRRLGDVKDRMDRMRGNFITEKMHKDELFLLDVIEVLREENHALRMQLIKRHRIAERSEADITASAVSMPRSGPR